MHEHRVANTPEEGKLLPVSVRVGQAVDVVAQVCLAFVVVAI